VTGGRILVDGDPIDQVTQTSLRAAIGVVPQDTVLFNDTIRYNIAYGRPGASEAEVIQASKLAQVHDFVARLPDGYRTMVGERGLKLSGGEKQRVAIARALAKEPTLMFADEPTSSLDGENGQIVIRLLRRAATQHGAAVIVVTHDHRLESFADRIIHMDDGHIASDRRVVATETPFYHPQTVGPAHDARAPALAGA